MEDLRNQEPKLFSAYIPNRNGFKVVIDNQQFMLNESQFIELHNTVTTTITEKMILEGESK